MSFTKIDNSLPKINHAHNKDKCQHIHYHYLFTYYVYYYVHILGIHNHPISVGVVLFAKFARNL